MGMTEILLAIGLLALGVAGIAIKILVKPDGEFSGTCQATTRCSGMTTEDAPCVARGPKTLVAPRIPHEHLRGSTPLAVQRQEFQQVNGADDAVTVQVPGTI